MVWHNFFKLYIKEVLKWLFCFSDVRRTLMGHVIGGMFWTLFSGQCLLVQLITAPLAIYIKGKCLSLSHTIHTHTYTKILLKNVAFWEILVVMIYMDKLKDQNFGSKCKYLLNIFFKEYKNN